MTARIAIVHFYIENDDEADAFDMLDERFVQWQDVEPAITSIEIKSIKLYRRPPPIRRRKRAKLEVPVK